MVLIPMLPIKLFAAARDIAGTDAVAVPLPGTVGELRTALAAARPELAAILPRCAIAVNLEYADDDCVLNSADEVAVIPPVSGG